MDRLGTLAAIAAAALGATGCSSVLRGGDTDRDVHLHLTYFMARAAGFGPREARAIAAADCYTDEHPETTSVGTELRIPGGLINPMAIPWIAIAGVADCALGGETPKRGFAGRTAQVTAWALSRLALRLHFPASGMYEKVKPAFVRDPETGDVYYNNRDAVAVLERAFRAFETHDEDIGRDLALLGIGLHTLQDSYKHRGYCAALGHIGSSPDADDISRDLPMALEIAEATLNSLRYVHRLLHGKSAPPPPGWREAFVRLYATPLRDGECRQDRWIEWIRTSFGDSCGGWEETCTAWGEEGADAFDRALELIVSPAAEGRKK